VDPQQRWLMRLLPVGFTAFLLNFPAGLFMYWITSNLMTLGQNYVIYNYGPGKKTPGTEKADAKAKDLQVNPSGSGQTPEQNAEDAAKQAAKVAKRKRRKKKK
jgi:YidC/Oxa1 family membrane protein insertase